MFLILVEIVRIHRLSFILPRRHTAHKSRLARSLLDRAAPAGGRLRQMLISNILYLVLVTLRIFAWQKPAKARITPSGFSEKQSIFRLGLRIFHWEHKVIFGRRVVQNHFLDFIDVSILNKSTHLTPGLIWLGCIILDQGTKFALGRPASPHGNLGARLRGLYFFSLRWIFCDLQNLEVYFRGIWADPALIARICPAVQARYLFLRLLIYYWVGGVRLGSASA